MINTFYSSKYILLFGVVCFLVCFRQGLANVVQGDIKLTVHPSQPPNYWDYRCVPPKPASSEYLLNLTCLFSVSGHFCLYVCQCMPGDSSNQKRALELPGSGVAYNCEPPYGS